MRGAAHVYAVDVGHGQLHPTIVGDARVTNLEGTDARALNTGRSSPNRSDLLVSDVSFISLKLVLPAAVALAEAARGPRRSGEAAIRGRARPREEGHRARRGRASRRVRGHDGVRRLARFHRHRVSCPPPSRAGTAIVNSCWEPAVAEQVSSSASARKPTASRRAHPAPSSCRRCCRAKRSPSSATDRMRISSASTSRRPNARRRSAPISTNAAAARRSTCSTASIRRGSRTRSFIPCARRGSRRPSSRWWMPMARDAGA